MHTEAVAQFSGTSVPIGALSAFPTQPNPTQPKHPSGLQSVLETINSSSPQEWKQETRPRSGRQQSEHPNHILQHHIPPHTPPAPNFFVSRRPAAFSGPLHPLSFSCTFLEGSPGSSLTKGQCAPGNSQNTEQARSQNDLGWTGPLELIRSKPVASEESENFTHPKKLSPPQTL